MNNSLKNNIKRTVSANLIITVVGFFSSFVFPKILSIESYALYHTYTLYIGYIAILHLGFPSGMVIKYAGVNYESIEKKQYKSEWLLLTTILFIFTVLFFIIGTISHSQMTTLVGLSIVPICVVGSYKGLVQAFGDFKEYARISVFIALTIPVLAILYYFIAKDLPGIVYILLYLVINIIACLYIYWITFKRLRGVKSNPIFSATNITTEKVGIIIVLGSYINTLFASADKQFVSWFFADAEFAYYSFAMSMQSIMLVLITSIAQPLFPAMAQGRFKDYEYDDLKTILYVFGSFSGCAYFVISIIIRNFIPSYINSLDVCSLYFSVFPAMAVIQCLYVNLYKIKGKTKTYVWTLVIVLLVAVALNLLMVKVYGKYTGVAIATVMTYYIWIIIGMIQFKFFSIKLRNFFYIIVYFAVYFTCINFFSDIIGLIVYTCLMIVAAFLFFSKSITKYIKIITERNCNV